MDVKEKRMDKEHNDEGKIKIKQTDNRKMRGKRRGSKRWQERKL